MEKNLVSGLLACCFGRIFLGLLYKTFPELKGINAVARLLFSKPYEMHKQLSLLLICSAVCCKALTLVDWQARQGVTRLLLKWDKCVHKG